MMPTYSLPVTSGPKRELYNSTLNNISPAISYESELGEEKIVVTGNPSHMRLEDLCLRVAILARETALTESVSFPVIPENPDLNLVLDVSKKQTHLQEISALLRLISHDNHALLSDTVSDMITVRIGDALYIEVPKQYNLFWNNRNFNSGEKEILGFNVPFKVNIRGINDNSVKEYQVLSSVSDDNFSIIASDWTVLIDSDTLHKVYIPNGRVTISEYGVSKEGDWGPVDPQDLTGHWTLTGNGKITKKGSGGYNIESEGLWGPVDSQNLSGAWDLTGVGKITETFPEIKTINLEGTWGLVDPQDISSDWDLTKEGKVIETFPDGRIVTMEGIWGLVDPQDINSAWDLTGEGKRIETFPDGKIIHLEGAWGKIDPQDEHISWKFTGVGKRIETFPNGLIIETEGVWSKNEPQKLDVYDRLNCIKKLVDIDMLNAG
jgi:hypothetical protein